MSRLEVRREPLRVRFLALPVLVPAVVVRGVGVPEHRERQVEVRVHVGLARSAHRRDGAAVVAHPAADDLGLSGPADRVLVVPGELDRDVVRLGARALEEHPRHRHRGDREEALGEVDGARVRAVPVGVVVAEGAHLLVGDLREPLDVEPERRAPEPRRAVEEPPSLVVDHVDPVSPAHDGGPRRFVEPEVRLRVNHGRDVARVRRVRSKGERGHFVLLRKGRASLLIGRQAPGPILARLRLGPTRQLIPSRARGPPARDNLHSVLWSNSVFFRLFSANTGLPA